MRAQLGSVSFMLGFASVLGGVASLAGCAGRELPPVAPQPTLAAAIEIPGAPSDDPAGDTSDGRPDHDLAPAPEPVKHHVAITVDRLPAAKTFSAGATTYVFWIRANDDDAWSNATHLEPTKREEEASFEFAQDTLFVHVTAEATADAHSPSAKVVFSARVSASVACAYGVNQRDVKMNVNMCH